MPVKVVIKNMNMMRILMASKAATGLGELEPATDGALNAFSKNSSLESMAYFRPTDFLSTQEWLRIFKS